MKKSHEHQWVYNGKTCCYKLLCSLCSKITSAHFFEGYPDLLKIGISVEFLPNGWHSTFKIKGTK